MNSPENPPLFAMLAVLSVLLAGFLGAFTWIGLLIGISSSFAAITGAVKHWDTSVPTMCISLIVGLLALIASLLLFAFKYMIHWTF